SIVSYAFRKFMKHIPAWMWRRLMIKMSVARPQVSFLPLVEDDATVKAQDQPSLHKTLAILKEQKKNDSFEAVVV
ncbi:hypothetical protein BG004_001657, partial [Podila humilis]